MVMGCNSGGVKGEGKVGGASGGNGRGLSGAMMEVGRSAENAFYVFLELVSDVLGFTAKFTTKKNEVGGYFSNLGAKLGEVSKELEKLAKNSETGGNKSDLSKNLIKEAVDAAIDTQETIPADNELKKAFKAFQAIYR